MAVIIIYWPTTKGSALATERPLLCDSDGYWLDDDYHSVEWSGRLIGTMVSGAEIGLATVSGTSYPAFDAYLGEELNIEKTYPEADWNSIIHIKGYWQGIDCELYRAIFEHKKYAINGQVCVPLIEAISITVE